MLQYRAVWGLLGILLVGAVERVYHTHQWAGRVNLQAQNGQVAAAFLAGPVVDPRSGQPLKLSNGQQLTVADALMVVINAKLREETDAQRQAPAGPRPPGR